MNKPKPDLLLHAAEGGEPESATSTLLGTTALSSEAPTVVSPVEPTPPAEPDPYDLASLRLTQAFTETVGTKKLITTVPVRKPKKQEWVRVHPGLEYRD